jgi:MFS superfamily sulfate permease-like transporter
VIVLLAGLIQILAGLLKTGQWFRAISPAVVQGMLAGIGILIVASQVYVMVDDLPRSSGMKNITSIPEALLKGLIPVDGSTHHLAAAVGVLTVGVIIAWGFAPKRLKVIPAPLVAVLVATLCSVIFQLPIKKVSVPDNILSSIQWPAAEMLGSAFEWPILGAALAIAMIASAETLLCATAVDRMHNGSRTQYNRELCAQGIGNLICGLIGSLPMTGVIVRSSANVKVGARTRLSAVMHGLWILICVALLPFLLNKIPTASLAAVLVYTGFKLVSPQVVRQLAHFGKFEVSIYAVTVIAIVVTNLLEGVLIGLGLSLLKLIYNFSHLEIHRHPEKGLTTLILSGSATFIRLPKLAAAFEAIPPDTNLRIDISQLLHIDHACLDLLADQGKQRAEAGGQLELEWDELYSKYQYGLRSEKSPARSRPIETSFRNLNTQSS